MMSFHQYFFNFCSAYFSCAGLHMCEKISVSNKMSGSEIKIEHALSNCSFLGVSLSSGV
jgi:hypothetical protein